MGGVKGWDVVDSPLAVAGLEVAVVSLVVKVVLDVVLCLLLIEGFQVLDSPMVEEMDIVLVLLVVGALEVAGGSVVTEGL